MSPPCYYLPPTLKCSARTCTRRSHRRHFDAVHVSSRADSIFLKNTAFRPLRVGRSAIEFWQSDAARADRTCGGGLNITPACPPAPARIDSRNITAPPVGNAPVGTGGWTPSCFYNAMLHPLGNFALKGFLWDQGEANYEDNCAVWGCKLAALAHDLRTTLFKQPELLFTFDQLRADAFAGISPFSEFIGIFSIDSYRRYPTYGAGCVCRPVSQGARDRVVWLCWRRQRMGVGGEGGDADCHLTFPKQATGLPPSCNLAMN